MATIRTRQRKDGSLAYLSEIRVKRDGVLIHRESKTFDRLGQARTWAATREKRLAKVEPVQRPTRTLANTRLAKILRKYRREASELRPMGRSKASHIRFLEKTEIARMQVCDIETADILLDIRDLNFHDLRHEATSRLFEAGYSIVEVHQFTLHDSWGTLSRYTQRSLECRGIAIARGRARPQADVE